MIPKSINYLNKIDIESLGWFWAINQNKVKEYYQEKYILPSDNLTRDRLLNPKHLGEIIMFDFLSQRPDLLGTLILRYTQDRMLIEWTIFNQPIQDLKYHEHDIFEYIWASFSHYMFSIKELSILFCVSQKEIRKRYREFDKQLSNYKNKGE